MSCQCQRTLCCRGFEKGEILLSAHILPILYTRPRLQSPHDFSACDGQAFSHSIVIRARTIVLLYPFSFGRKLSIVPSWHSLKRQSTLHATFLVREYQGYLQSQSITLRHLYEIAFQLSTIMAAQLFHSHKNQGTSRGESPDYPTVLSSRRETAGDWGHKKGLAHPSLPLKPPAHVSNAKSTWRFTSSFSFSCSEKKGLEQGPPAPGTKRTTLSLYLLYFTVLTYVALISLFLFPFFFPVCGNGRKRKRKLG